jgi:hypothetical protein
MPHEADGVDCWSWNMGSGALQVGGNDRWGRYGLGGMAIAEFVVEASLRILESYGDIELKNCTCDINEALSAATA